MQSLPNEKLSRSGSVVFFRKSLRALSRSSIGQGLIHNGRVGVRKYRQFFSTIFNGLNTGFDLGWKESGVKETIRKGKLLLAELRRKISVGLKVSPVALSLIQFIFLAQMIALPLSADLNFSMAVPVWSGILFTLLLLFVLQKNINKAAKNNGLVLLWIIVTISAVFAAFGFRSDYYLLIGLYLISAWLSGWVLTKDNVRAVMKYTVYSSPLWMMLGIVQKISGAATPSGWVGPGQEWSIPVRIYSIFKNPNVFSIYLVVVLICAYYLRIEALGRENGTDPGVARIGRRGTDLIFGGIILLDVISLYYTYSRISWLIATVLFIYWNKRRLNYKTWIWVGGVIAAAFLLCPGFQSRVSSAVSFSDSSIWQRFNIWKGVWDAIKEYGWWGTGPGNFYAAYAAFGSSAAPWAQHAHEQFLQIWLENGFISLLAFFAIIIKGVRRFFGEDLIVKAMGLSLAAFLIYGLTETLTASPFLGGLFWLMMGFGEASLSGIVRMGSPKTK